MKVDFNTPIKDIKGVVVKNGQDDLTLESIACTVLLGVAAGDENIDPKVKIRRFKLAVKLSEGKGEVDLSAEDIADLKALIGKNYAPLVVGRAFEILDPEIADGKSE